MIPTPARPAAATDGAAVSVHGSLVYAERPGYRPLLLDLHLPEAAPNPPPLVVFAHGGGWFRGARGELGPAFAGWRPGPFELVAAEGLAVASVDYRLSGEARYPAQLDDVDAAVTWLTERAADFGFDAARLVLWGESAGAHLASLLALTGRHPASGVVDWYGPADLLAPSAPVGDDPLDTREARLLGAPPATVADLARRASPLHQVRGGAPPFLIVHGTDDTAVPIGHSRAFAAALAAAGNDVRLVEVPGADHLWRGVADPEPLLRAVVSFVREVTAGT